MMAQACHICFEFAKQHPEITNEWIINSNHIAVLEVNDESELINLNEKANYKNISTSFFREPDLDNQITAIALSPGNAAKELCSKLSLAFKNRADIL